MDIICTFTPLIIFALIAIFPLSILLMLYGKHIEVDFTRQMIYGWYDGKILISKPFGSRFNSNEILGVKKLVEKQLDEMIEKYKQVNK